MLLVVVPEIIHVNSVDLGPWIPDMACRVREPRLEPSAVVSVVHSRRRGTFRPREYTP